MPPKRCEPMNGTDSTDRQTTARSEVILVICGVALFVFHALYFSELFRGNCVDDAYISFRYLENLLGGDGLVFNAGERVEGYSNFLWILVLAPFAVFAESIEPVAVWVGIGLGAACIACSVVALKRLFPGAGVLAVGFVTFGLATSGYFAAWAVGGMENMLYATLLVVGWSRTVRELREASLRPLSGLVWAALAMTRPEGIIVAIGALGLRTVFAFSRREEWCRLRQFAIFLLVPLVAYHGFRFAYYGPHLWPNSVRAKVGGGLQAFELGWVYVKDEFLIAYPWIIIPVVASFIRFRNLAIVSGTALLLGYLLFVASVGGDWSHGRFFTALLPLVMVLTAGSLAGVDLRRIGKQRELAAVGALLAALMLFHAYHETATEREAKFFIQFAPLDAERIALGKWLHEVAPPETKIAVFAAGQIPYYSRLYAHDMLGINDAHIAGLSMPEQLRGYAGHEKFDVDYTLREVRPDVIVDAHHVLGMTKHPLFRQGYQWLRFWRHNHVVVRRDWFADWRARPPEEPK